MFYSWGGIPGRYLVVGESQRKVSRSDLADLAPARQVITVGEGCVCQEYSFRRRQLIYWTCEISARLGLTTQTVHMAVRWDSGINLCVTVMLRYLDRFMSGHDIMEPQLYLVCCCSVLLAAKVCERESLIPRLSSLTALLPVKLTERELQAVE